MKIVNFHIEKTGTGYSAYAAEYSIIATGKTLPLVYKDAQDGLKDQCEYLNTNPTDYTIEYSYDFATLIDVTRLNVDALSKLSGLNPTLMSQYINGKKKPGPKQKQRIEAGIHEYAKTLSSFHFA